jgi:hypothetical protein
MTPEQFAYWLNGFVELEGGAAPSAAQWKSICEHLKTVFNKVTPQVADAQKYTESDLQKTLREFAEKQARQTHQSIQTWPGFPGQMPGSGYTITC